MTPTRRVLPPIRRPGRVASMRLVPASFRTHTERWENGVKYREPREELLTVGRPAKTRKPVKQAKRLDWAARADRYMRQNGSQRLTLRQQRRVAQKAKLSRIGGAS